MVNVRRMDVATSPPATPRGEWDNSFAVVLPTHPAWSPTYKERCAGKVKAKQRAAERLAAARSSRGAAVTPEGRHTSPWHVRGWSLRPASG